jgi:hypothetical protein
MHTVNGVLPGTSETPTSNRLLLELESLLSGISFGLPKTARAIAQIAQSSEKHCFVG